MSAPAPGRRATGFFVGFLVVALLIAGVLSAFASSDPDGLDTVTLQGCQVAETEAGERLEGTCIAQQAQDHDLAGSPLADYAVNAGEGTTWLAGIIGVLVTLVVAGGLFAVLRRRSGPGPGSDAGSGR